MIENSLNRTRDSVDASVRVESVCIVLAQHRPRFVNHGANFAVEMRDNAKKTRHLRDYSGYGLGQWEEALYSNTSHWLSPHAGWSLHILEWLVWFFITPDTIDPFHKSHNASYIYPAMHHFVAEMCTFLLQNDKLWDIGQVHCGICEMGLFAVGMRTNCVPCGSRRALFPCGVTCCLSTPILKD